MNALPRSVPSGGQLAMFGRARPRNQLLKWIGNKYRHAGQIADILPSTYRRYIEPFVGTGAVLATMQPEDGIAGDALRPLIEIWHCLQSCPEKLLEHYERVWTQYMKHPREAYARVRASYNAAPNGFDLLFISRACYGGVVRFTTQGELSTPVGPHKAISPDALADRIAVWRERVANTRFVHADFEETMAQAGEGDVIYCDPPYVDSQPILYGSQGFRLHRLWEAIQGARSREARIALSLDGMKKSGRVYVSIQPPDGLFEREMMLDSGRSMLRRFQKSGESMAGETVHERLLLTW